MNKLELMLSVAENYKVERVEGLYKMYNREFVQYGGKRWSYKKMLKFANAHRPEDIGVDEMETFNFIHLEKGEEHLLIDTLTDDAQYPNSIQFLYDWKKEKYLSYKKSKKLIPLEEARIEEAQRIKDLKIIAAWEPRPEVLFNDRKISNFAEEHFAGCDDVNQKFEELADTEDQLFLNALVKAKYYFEEVMK